MRKRIMELLTILYDVTEHSQSNKSKRRSDW